MRCCHYKFILIGCILFFLFTSLTPIQGNSLRTDFFLTTQDPNDSIQKLIEKAKLFEKQRNDSLEVISKRIIRLSQNAPEYRAKGHYLLAYFHRIKYEYLVSAKNYDIAAKLYQSAGNTKEHLASLLELGKAYHFADSHAKSLEIFRKYNHEAIRAGDSLHIADSFLVIGTELGHLDSLESKLVAYRKALIIYDNLNDERSKARLINNMAGVYSSLKEYENSREYYERYLETLRRFPESELELSYGLNNLGNTYIKLNDYEKAKSSLNEALEIKRRLNVRPSIANTLNILGLLYTELGAFNKSIEYLEEALSIGQEVDSKDLIYSAEAKLGLAHLKLGNLKKSEEYLLNVLITFDSAPKDTDDILVLESLSELYQKKGEYQKALQFYQRARFLNDSIQNLERLANINKLKTEFEVKEQELEISKLKSDKLLQEAEIDKKKREQTVFITTIIIGCLIILFLYMAFASRKKKNEQLLKARQALEDKNAQLNENKVQLTLSNQEKEVLLKEVHHRVKNNLQIANSLLSIQARQSNKIGDINEFLYNSQNRLQSIALIHETLYASQNLAEVQVGDYLDKLSDYMIEVGIQDTDEISIEKDFGDYGLDIQRVVPLGLIFSELLMNALKHAFSDNKGKLHLSFQRKEDSYVLQVIDNGTGFQEKNGKSLGLELVHLLTEQLLGTIALKNEKGTRAELEFPAASYPE
ncbi:MAG: tetratricopeptide repeat protein [Bacteroidota bacterium]